MAKLCSSAVGKPGLEDVPHSVRNRTGNPGCAVGFLPKGRSTMSDDPRLDTTRRWSRGKITLYIVGIIVVFAVASSVFWLPVLVGTD